MSSHHRKWISAILACALAGQVALAQSGGFSVDVGDILVANYEGFSVARIDPRTGNQEELGTFILPTDLALASDGMLYVAELEGGIWRLDIAAGLFTPILEPGAGPASIFGIALGPQGELYVTSGADDVVYRVDPATGNASPLAAGGSLVGVVGIDRLDEEHLVVSCSSASTSRLVSIALADGAQTVIASGGELDQPWGVAVHDTTIFTTAYDSRRVLQVAQGEITALAQTPGFPYGIAVDGAGNVYVGSKGQADEIRVYAPDGTWLEAFSGGWIRLAAGIEIAQIRIDPASPLTLQSAASVDGPFEDLPATIDTSQQTIRTPRQPGDRFYRLRAGTTTRITNIQLGPEELTLRWE